MAYTATVNRNTALAGKSFASAVEVSGEGHAGKDKDDIPAAKAGTLTTRTDANTGTLTMAGGHGITTAARLDLYWDGGRRYNVTVGTVSGNSVPIDLGSGDDLPIATTAITAMVPIEESVPFEGDGAIIITAFSEAIGMIVLEDAGGIELVIDLVANGDYLWNRNDGLTNPVSGDSITKAFFSHSDSVNAKDMRIGVLLD